MAIEILKNIEKIDQKVKDHFSGALPEKTPKIGQLIKWAPLAATLLPGEAGQEAKRDLSHRVKIIAVSETILNAVLHLTKKFVPRNRPDSLFKSDSFPSGHTATSFLGAEILRYTFPAKRPGLRLLGYAVATGTAAVRVYQKKHWLSDVVAGAVIGIAAARLAIWIVRKQAHAAEEAAVA
ncbi:MAG: hypothetical protein JWQ78_1330 [Sediminibacterium sp.]|nr:hypothetical protein [Sediminibacterium sp.]